MLTRRAAWKRAAAAAGGQWRRQSTGWVSPRPPRQVREHVSPDAAAGEVTMLAHNSAPFVKKHVKMSNFCALK